MADHTTFLDIVDAPEVTFDLQRECKAKGEEFLFVLSHSQVNVNRLSVSVLPTDPLLNEQALADVFVGYGSTVNPGCKKETQDGAPTLEGYETILGEKVAVWMLCKNAPASATEYAVKISEKYFINSQEKSSKLSKGGIAGVTILAIVALVFILCLFYSVRNSLTFK